MALDSTNVYLKEISCILGIRLVMSVEKGCFCSNFVHKMIWAHVSCEEFANPSLRIIMIFKQNNYNS